jgi:hypothetical protein
LRFELGQIKGRQANGCKGEVRATRLGCPKDAEKVGRGRVQLIIKAHRDSIARTQRGNGVLLPPSRRKDTEELSGGITCFDARNPGTLPGNGSLQRSETEKLEFQRSPQRDFRRNQRPSFLSHVKTENNLMSHQDEVTDGA